MKFKKILSIAFAVIAVLGVVLAFTGRIIAIDHPSDYREKQEEIKVPEKVFPVRLWYMHDRDVCTLIEVDEPSRQVHIKNYTDMLMFRAFGVNEKPDYEDYTEFLESRCFPRTRDKMKLVLKDLDLPFYDPFLIVEKTEGRMAEDHFWIKIER